MKVLPVWLIPVDDGSAPARVEIRERVVPPGVLLELGSPSRLMTPLEAAQLAQALQEASHDAAQLGAKARKR